MLVPRRVFPSWAAIWAVLLLLSLPGCARDSGLRTPGGNLQQAEIPANGWRMKTFSRLTDTNQPLTLYIEGDVRGWRPTADPGVDETPDEYVGLRLIDLDPSPNVVLIASPCQFGSNEELCMSDQWKEGPFADQVYRAYDRIIDHFEVYFAHPKLNLVGYSGGGAIAAVLAARRHETISLRTIGGNLDPNGAGRAHASDPNDDFIDPMSIARRLAYLPQEHFVGEKDEFVPPFLTENFIKAIGRSYCVKVTRVPGATHRTGWEEMWKKNVQRMPVCGAPNTL